MHTTASTQRCARLLAGWLRTGCKGTAGCRQAVLGQAHKLGSDIADMGWSAHLQQTCRTCLILPVVQLRTLHCHKALLQPASAAHLQSAGAAGAH